MNSSCHEPSLSFKVGMNLSRKGTSTLKLFELQFEDGPLEKEAVLKGAVCARQPQQRPLLPHRPSYLDMLRTVQFSLF